MRHTLEVLADDAARWYAGELVQRAFPEMPADDREILMSGYCAEGWDAEVADLEED